MKKIIHTLLMLLCAHAIVAQELDLSFNGYGFFITPAAPTFPVFSSEKMLSMVRQSDGKILFSTTLAGLGICFRRLNADGTPDQSFGTNGMLSYNSQQVGAYLTGKCFVLSDDKILMVSYYDGNFVFKRFNADGSIDASYGNALGYPGTRVFYYYPINILLEFQMTADDKIVAVATSQMQLPGEFPDIDDYYRKLVVAKFDTDGNPDLTFNGTGFFTAVQTDYIREPKSFCIKDNIITVLIGNQKFYNIQYDTGLPAAIGDTGVLYLPLYDYMDKIFATPNGYLGVWSHYPDDTRVSLRDINMTKDLSFGTSGTAFVPVRIDDMKVQTDGKLVFAGNGVGSMDQVSYYRLAMARLNANGTIDSANSPGTYTVGIGNYGNSVTNELLIQPDGKYVIGGYEMIDDSGFPSQEKWETFVLRLWPENALGDDTFNANRFSVYPNPFKNRIRLAYQNEAPSEIQLFDWQGRMTYTTQDLQDSAAFEREIVLPDHLSKGNYLLRITTPTGKTSNIKMIKD